MASRQEIRERGALIARWHVRDLVDPSRMVLEKDEREGNWTVWHLGYRDGDGGWNGVCYIGVGMKKEHALVSFEVHGKGREYRKYDAFWQAEADPELMKELRERVKGLIGEGGKE